MDKVKLKTELRTLVVAIMILWSCIGIGLIIVLSLRELYYIDMESMRLNEVSGFRLDKIRLNYNILMDYCTALDNRELKFSGLRVTEAAYIHFKTVRTMMRFIVISSLVTACISVVKVIQHYKRLDTDFFRRVVIMTFCIPMIIVAMALSDWTNFFKGFHSIFFAGDHWEFSWFDDEIIRILPDAYFKQCAIIITAIMMMGSMAVWIAWYRVELGETLSRKRFKGGKLVEEFKIGSVTFDKCFKYELMEIDGTIGWLIQAKENISKFSCRSEFKGYPVINMWGTFRNYSFTEIDVSGMDVSKVINLNSAFENCRAYKIDISNWKIDNAVYMERMFSSKYTKEIDLTGVDLNHVSSMISMFENSEAKILGLVEINAEKKRINNIFRKFKGSIKIKILNCSREQADYITRIVDYSVVEDESDADRLLEKADSLRLERAIVAIKKKE